MLKDCFACFDETTGILRLGNNRIEKQIRLIGSFICTEKITERTSGKEWTGKKRLLQRCPVLGAEESPSVQFETVVNETPLGIRPHLKAVLELTGMQGTVWYEYMIFPEIPFVYSQSFVMKTGESIIQETASKDPNCSGIENQYTSMATEDVFCDADTLDCIPLCQAHLEVETFKLYDKTDNNDALVERQKTPVYMFKNGRLERDGNIFHISDYPMGDSLMIIKHSPTESSALNRRNKDLIFSGTAYASLMGSGVDYSALPAGRVPCYASAVGVAKTTDIFEQLWQYSSALSVGDPRDDLFIMSNTWGDRSQDMAVCEQFILKELDRAHQLGVDILQIDDGWQKGITANSLRKAGGVWEGYYKDDSDFWQINPERFPNGLEPVIQQARKYGIEIGLWFSPDSSEDFVNVEKDVETLMRLYSKYGIRYFKLDGIKIRNKLCEMRFIYLMEELTKRTKGDIRFNLDVTAEDRFGYLYMPWFGTLFVENRYTDFVNYFPHNTFKNLWNLASVLPSRRLQMELLNNRRNTDKYQGLPFAPAQYRIDYLFATVIPANPLMWMEMTHLLDEDAQLLANISKVYKQYSKELFLSRVIPVGEAPNGMGFSGYFCRNSDKKTGHLLVFRESAEEDTYTFTLPVDMKQAQLELLYKSAEVEITQGTNSITVNFGQQKMFAWIKIY